MAQQFQSTRPVWGATVLPQELVVRENRFQSTRPVWGATKILYLLQSDVGISIHAPRVGRDDNYIISD